MKNVSAKTVARTIVLFLALLNQLLATFGKGTLDIVEDDVYQVVSLIVTIGSTLVVWWKNNSFTGAAVEADEVLKELKNDGR